MTERLQQVNVKDVMETMSTLVINNNIYNHWSLASCPGNCLGLNVLLNLLTINKLFKSITNNVIHWL